jgi:hypothetical protein
MNDLNKALGDISSIRRQVAHATEFRGYGPATLVGTGSSHVAALGAVPEIVCAIPVHSALS